VERRSLRTRSERADAPDFAGACGGDLESASTPWMDVAARRWSRAGRRIFAIGAIAAGCLMQSARMNAGVVHPSDKLTEDEKISLVRDLDAEYAKARTLIPRSKKALAVESNGTWNKAEWQKSAQTMGAAARLGDQVQITKVSLDGDRLVLELNGGLKSGHKWYDNVQIGMGPTAPVSNRNRTPSLGTIIELDFHKPMENLTADDVKKILSPLLDFDKRTVTKVYTETLPPAMQNAIKQKRAIEGMDREQVTMALGHPDHKYREAKNGVDTEDWIYGTPPGKITFVTFAGSKVVKVKEEYAGLGMVSDNEHQN
jgi:hypothetical protein